MDVKMMRIAESKVRQLGGDVCGVLVRTDGEVMAVSEHGRCTRLDAGVMGPVDGAHGGQGVEPVGFDFDGWYDKHESLFRDGAGKSDLRAAYKQGYRDSQPQPAVPEGVQELIEQRDVFEAQASEYKKAYEALLSAPTTPQADGWVRCEDRLPTEADEDERNELWTCLKDVNGKFRISRSNNAAFVEAFCQQYGAKNFWWMPTGLKRPLPPTGQEGA